MRIENVVSRDQVPQTAATGRVPADMQPSSLSSLNQITAKEKIQKHFWHAWDFVKSTLVWVYDTILWVFQGCPAEDNPLDIMEDIIESPKEMASEFAKKPAEFTAEIILAALLNPKGIKDLRDKNKGAFGDFLRECQGKVSNWKKQFSPKKGFKLEKSLTEALYKNPVLLHSALITIRDLILGILGDEDKKGDNENIIALRRICNGYLQKVIDHGGVHPEVLAGLLKALVAKGDPAGFVAVFQQVAKPAPSSKEAADLVKIFNEKALVLRWLAEPKKFLGKKYKDASPLSGFDKIFETYPMAFHQAIFRAMETKHFESVLEILDDNFTLGTAVVQKIKALGTKAQSRIADNLPEAMRVLEQLDKDLANPPRKG